jgi:hypothetical protein
MNKIPIFIMTLFAFLIHAQEAPVGSVSSPKKDECRRLEALKGTITGHIAWASSRSNSKHDIWIMNADGTGKRQLTRSDHVDWYTRFSPCGNRILFARSKSGWVPEGDADIFDKWDLWTVGIDGSDEEKVAESGSWGTWRPSGDSIVFARGPKVLIKDLKSGNETELFDAGIKLKKGAYAQQPQLSPDGSLLAMTVRGTRRRETGIWNLKTGKWYTLGGGCQVEWFPSGKRILRMNEGQGNGGTELLAINIDSRGKPTDRISGLSIPKNIRFMDLPGRRSHEYFPKFNQDGTWLVWCATQKGHEHDMADYEVYLWKIGSDKKKGPVRLTFHSGNDRWPDIFTGSPKPKKAAEPAETGRQTESTPPAQSGDTTSPEDSTDRTVPEASEDMPQQAPAEQP